MKTMRLFLVLLLTSCTNQSPNKVDSSWSQKMQKTAFHFQKLLPALYSQEQFENKKNNTVLKKRIKSFKESIHSIDPKQAKTILGDDPYVMKSLETILELTDRASISFNRGDKQNARILLKATTNSCFKCHTRQNLGPQSMAWKNLNIEELKTNALEKSHLLISMRQFDEAKNILNEFLSESEDNHTFDMTYERALHYHLMIELRGQEKMSSALNFINRKVLIPDIPTRLHYTLKHWQKDLLFWNKHKLSTSIQSVKKILARNKSQYSDRNLINNLVASQALHGLITKKISQIEKAKSYYYLGQVYDELIVEGYWDLPEIYYEMCIQTLPKSTLAQKCFKAYKENITIGYSGTRGTLIPDQEYKRIERLRKASGLR